MTTEPTVWIPLTHAMRLAHASRYTVARWADEARIGSRQLPGMTRQFHRGDLLKLIEASTTHAHQAGQTPADLAHAG